MIYSLKGKVILIKDDFVILEVMNVGYKISVGTFNLKLKKEQESFVYTYQSVRENSLELFGFETLPELHLFELLISISGIGPKAAMGILSVTTPSSLKKAVISQNLDELTKVSGIGKKNAQKILIELANKIDRLEISISDFDNNFDIETFETLEALGFNRVEIQETLKNISGKNSKEKLKEALKILGKK